MAAPRQAAGAAFVVALRIFVTFDAHLRLRMTDASGAAGIRDARWIAVATLFVATHAHGAVTLAATSSLPKVFCPTSFTVGSRRIAVLDCPPAEEAAELIRI